ncbi:oligosaccharyl transferase stt3 subunit, partial [Serendipita sp. 398]
EPVDPENPTAPTPATPATSTEHPATPVTPRSTTAKTTGVFGIDTRLAVVFNTFFLLLIFVVHCTWTTSHAYSSPSVVLASRGPDGSSSVIDDFREAYYWLRQNTPQDAVVMSWWDYGYQIAGMADRPTLVDNNTWNNTHIATVGKAFASSEEVAYPLLKKHDVSYVLVLLGSLIQYSGDDLNKFLWMIRIASGVWPDEVKEADFFTSRGEFKVDDQATKTMSESLMYKMSYYRFNELFPPGQAADRVRNQKLPTVGPTLDYFDEAFTSENWIVRIYAVRKDDELGRDHKTANAFDAGKKRKKGRIAKRRFALE